MVGRMNLLSDVRFPFVYHVLCAREDGEGKAVADGNVGSGREKKSMYIHKYLC